MIAKARLVGKRSMRILIASDIHGSLESARFLQQKAQELQPKLCILLGDYLYHGPRNPLPEQYTPQAVAQKLGDIMDYGTEILAVRGNCDALVDEGLIPFPLTESLQLYVDGYSLMAAHGHQFGRDPDFSLIPKGTVMLTGHTHVPVAGEREHVYWWNPGSISLPKSGYPRSYAIYEDGTFTVYDMQERVYLKHTLP